MSKASFFRTLRVSDPRFERDNLRFITVKSQHLGGRGSISVYVPPNVTAGITPLVTLLHGVYGSHFSWAMGAGAHLTTARLIQQGKIRPMIIIMPSDGLWGDGSGYIPRGIQNFEKWIVEDVLEAIYEVVPEVDQTCPHFISGLSMGGYGALRLGIKYANIYKGISAHSAITCWEEMKIFVEEDIEKMAPPLGEKDILELISSRKANLPHLRFDCGTEDILLEGNRTLHETLQSMKISHIYEEFSGGHEWKYWETHLEDTLSFFESISV